MLAVIYIFIINKQADKYAYLKAFLINSLDFKISKDSDNAQYLSTKVNIKPSIGQNMLFHNVV